MQTLNTWGRQYSRLAQMFHPDSAAVVGLFARLGIVQRG